MAERIYRDEDAKRKALLSRVGELFKWRRSVLIGTCSVEESEQVSLWLEQEQIPHRVLNAKQDQHEAEIISAAGQLQAITVATNMAGRGTDISLSKTVAALGGLHVIALGRNDSKRVDRQLYGRCARQGDPGSAEAILSLQDPTLVKFYSPTMLKLLARFTPQNKPMADVNLDEFDRMMNINFRGIFIGIQTALPLMRKTAKDGPAGSIINVSSDAAIRAYALQTVKNMGKHVDAFVHIGPGDVTAGMAKRSVPDVPVLIVNNEATMQEAFEALNEMSTAKEPS